MPLNGSTYVAPTWRNGGPPALDAAELQAISDSIVRSQTGVSGLQSSMSGVQEEISALQAGKAQIQVGSYVGTGTGGESNPNSITCSFEPKIAIVSMDDINRYPTYMYVAILSPVSDVYKITGYEFGSSATQDITNTKEAFFLYTKIINNTIYWYGGNENYQGNVRNQIYKWIAIG